MDATDRRPCATRAHTLGEHPTKPNTNTSLAADSAGTFVWVRGADIQGEGLIRYAHLVRYTRAGRGVSRPTHYTAVLRTRAGGRERVAEGGSMA